MAQVHRKFTREKKNAKHEINPHTFYFDLQEKNYFKLSSKNFISAIPLF